MAKRAQIGDWRYHVEYLDHAAGVACMTANGGDPDRDTMWDFCSQEEISKYREFPTKAKAVAWARRNKKLDVFHAPRIEEQTFTERPADWRHFAVPGSWERSGYWEADGQTEIEGDADAAT